MNYIIPEHLDLVKEIDKYLRDKTSGDLYIDLWVKKDFVPFKAIYNMSDFPNYEGKCFKHKYNLSAIYIKVYIEENEHFELVLNYKSLTKVINSINDVIEFLTNVYTTIVDTKKENLTKEELITKMIYEKYFL